MVERKQKGENVKTRCANRCFYSPFPRTPYNPDSRQKSRNCIMSGSSDAFKRQQGITFNPALGSLCEARRCAVAVVPNATAGACSPAGVQACRKSRNRIVRFDSTATFPARFRTVARIYSVPTLRPPDIGFP